MDFGGVLIWGFDKIALYYYLAHLLNFWLHFELRA